MIATGEISGDKDTLCSGIFPSKAQPKNVEQRLQGICCDLETGKERTGRKTRVNRIRCASHTVSSFPNFLRSLYRQMAP